MTTNEKDSSKQAITICKKTEESVMKAKEQYDLLFNSVTEGFAHYKAVCDENGKLNDILVLDINPSGALQSGVSREGQIGKSWRQVWAGIPESVFDTYNQVMQTGAPYKFEHFSPITKRWYISNITLIAKDQFAVTFFDITDRKEAEEEVVRAKEHTELDRKHLEAILATIPSAVVIVEASGEFSYLNKRALNLYGIDYAGYDLNTHIAKVKALKSDETPFPLEEMPVSLSLKFGREIRDVEMTIQSVTGVRLPVSVSSAPLRNSQGKVVSAVVTFEDVTERKKAEEALKQSEQRYRQLFSSMTEMFQVIELIFDKNGKAIDYYYRDVNPAFEKLVKKTREQLIDKRVKAVFGIVEDYWLEAYNRVAKTGNPTHFENYGAELERWYDVYVWKANDKQVAITFTDITERKKAEDALEESELKFKTLAENAPDPIMRFDPNLRITYLNPSDLAIAGLTLEDALGKTNEELGMPAELCKLWNETFDRARTTKHVQQVEFNFNSIAGVKIFDLRIVPEFAEDGSLTSFMGISHDITRQKKAEQELENHRNHLEKLVEEKTNQLKDSERLAAIGATAGMVGHDIRNPLQAITGDLYLVKIELSELPDHQQKKNALESVDEIQKNIDYINKIVADLQDYARPLNPHAQETNIKSVVDEIVIKNGIPKNIKLSIDVEDKAEKIMADPDYIKRIVGNLTLNAVQAMPDGGKLTIRACLDKQTNDTLITVSDTGVGIPEDVKPKLFTPMMTTKSKGQGFGLAVVKRMTEGLGGTVTFESQEGKGTTFIVRLPPQRAKR